MSDKSHAATIPSEWSEPFREGWNSALEEAAVFFEQHAPTLDSKLEWRMKKVQHERWQRMVAEAIRGMKENA